MLLLTTAIVLLCVGSAASYCDPTIELCGTQSCESPNRCQNMSDGVSVCVRDPAPTCDGVDCPEGQECTLQQDNCTSLPCNPQPTCVSTNPCGTCIAPSEFCQLLPSPMCRFVVEPRCNNKVCPSGQECKEVPFVCIRSPCGIELVCE